MGGVLKLHLALQVVGDNKAEMLRLAQMVEIRFPYPNSQVVISTCIQATYFLATVVECIIIQVCTNENKQMSALTSVYRYF